MAHTQETIRLGSHYLLDGLLGRGGMGAVHLPADYLTGGIVLLQTGESSWQRA